MDMETALIYAILTVIIGIVVSILARTIVRWLKKYAETTRTHWDDIIIAAIGTPVQVGIVAVSVYIALKYFGIVPEEYAWTISDEVLNSIYILLGTWIASPLAHNIILNYGHDLAEKGEGPLNDRLIEFLELTARYVIWFIGIMLILVNLDVNITPFLAVGRVSSVWHLRSRPRTLSLTFTAEPLLRLTSRYKSVTGLKSNIIMGM